jgi:hypothetical protein
MTKPQYEAMIEATFNEIVTTLRQKNADYTGVSEDPFANFRLSELEGVPPERGLMIRVQDKMQRIRSFMDQGRSFVEGESFEDAIHDIIGYMVLLKGLLLEQMQNDPLRLD